MASANKKAAIIKETPLQKSAAKPSVKFTIKIEKNNTDVKTIDLYFIPQKINY